MVLRTLALLAVLMAAAPGYCADKPGRPLTGDARIRHLLNRTAFGPRPGDIERVRNMGVGRYIDEQLQPDKIDDAACDALLAGLTTLAMSPADLTQSYRESVRQTRQAAALRKNAAVPSPLQPGQREGRAFLARLTGELQEGKVIRAAESKRQLQEVMVDFWTNHFNIDARKNVDRALKTVDDREVIRPFALGRFRQILGASAHSPAMLIYLDNARSSAARPGTPARRAAGVNENYARELMELHTLGVDGGYTQKDVQEVARCFTGWSVDPLTGEFRFYPGRHDDGSKVVLGQAIPAGGGALDGETVLDILARRPSTARFISLKLCRRFIADNPPKTAVDRAAAVFRKTNGDIRQVVRAILTSPEFNSTAAVGSKIKSPLEFAVSAVRALDGHLTPGPSGPRSLAGRIAALGEPLFQCQPPTGYPEVSAEWMGAGSLIARLNFASDLVRGTVAGVTLPQRDTPSPGGFEAVRTADGILGPEVSATTRVTLAKAQSDGVAGDGSVEVLALGAPEFQRR